MPEQSNLREALFLRLPVPLARLAYALARSTFRKDPREPYFDRAFRRVAESQCPGDYLEFGVYRGASFITNYKLARKHRLSDMRFFAFDCFAGLPEGEDDVWEPGIYRCSKARFLGNIERAGVPRDKVRVVEGLYGDTLTIETKRRHALARAAVVHVDCDLYSSTSTVLSFIEDLIHEGSVLIFDDWYVSGGEARRGEQRAFDEWPLNKCFEELYRAGRGRAFICTKPVAASPHRMSA